MLKTRAAFLMLVLSLLCGATAIAEDAPKADETKPAEAAPATPAAAVAPAEAEEPKEEPDPPPADIIAAARTGDIKATEKFLAENPAVLNARTPLQDTPLHWAASCAKVEIVRLLLSRHADVNAKNISGSTPLHMGCRAANKEIVELLLAAGADVNAKAELDDNIMPLHIAVFKNDLDITEMLLKKKADVAAKSASLTPMDIAKAQNRSAMIRLLRKHGAAGEEDE
jgi:ankyrin repeat protein